MNPHLCPDLEVLFTELEAGEGPALDHAAECAACAAVLEEHRLMEQDLYRLADPLPRPPWWPASWRACPPNPCPGAARSGPGWPSC